MKKRYGSKFKIQVALEAIRGDRTIAEIASEYNIHPNLVGLWKKKLLKEAADVFATKKEKESETQFPEDELLRKIGLTAAAMFILSAVILFITFWVVYVVIYLGSDWIYPLSHTALCCSSLIVIALLFRGNIKTCKEYLSQYSFTTGTATDEIVVFSNGASNINPLAPDSMHSYAKLITNILYIGPNIFMFALTNLKKAIHFAKIDIAECAEVIKLLFESDEKIPISNISSQLSLTCNKVFLDLSSLDGVLFLSKDQPSLALSGTIREELEAMS